MIEKNSKPPKSAPLSYRGSSSTYPEVERPDEPRATGDVRPTADPKKPVRITQSGFRPHLKGL